MSRFARTVFVLLAAFGVAALGCTEENAAAVGNDDGGWIEKDAESNEGGDSDGSQNNSNGNNSNAN
ncbi:MAG: hypothetical protein ACOCV2_09475, partial [Persicimonas sp.]